MKLYFDLSNTSEGGVLGLFLVNSILGTNKPRTINNSIYIKFIVLFLPHYLSLDSKLPKYTPGKIKPSTILIFNINPNNEVTPVLLEAKNQLLLIFA